MSRETEIESTDLQDSTNSLRNGDVSLVLVAHPCNPSYSGVRDQEDCCSKPDWEIVSETLSRKPFHKNRVGGVAQGKGPEYKPQYNKKKEKKEMGV
jgi:hypothetical protein